MSISVNNSQYSYYFQCLLWLRRRGGLYTWRTFHFFMEVLRVVSLKLAMALLFMVSSRRRWVMQCNLRRLFAAIIAAILPTHSYAAYECNVNIKYLLVYADGAVNVMHSGRNDYTVICNLNTQYGTASPTTCAMWTALLLGVKKRQAMAVFYYPGTGSCATLPTYGDAPVPTYIGEIP